MKLSPIQILASTAGAVVSAVIASFFGVKGTIIGVAVGSAVATLSTALVAHAIQRTHRAVRQVVVRPNAPRLLRRIGETRPAGDVAHESPGDIGAPVEPVTGNAAGGAAGPEAGGPGGPAPGAVAPGAVAPGERTGFVSPTPVVSHPSRDRTRWPVLLAAVAGVFVVGLLVVTGIELVAGRPLASLLGASKDQGGISLAPTPTTSTTTTTTSTTTSTTTTTVPSTSTTSTTVPGSTTTTAPGTTTSTSPGASTTISTAPGSTTTGGTSGGR